MSDLIRREDALKAVDMWESDWVSTDSAIRALPPVQPDARIKEYEEAYQYALHLAEALRENYPPNPDFRFLGDLAGLLTQIDNMVAGLSQSAVQPDIRPDLLEAACVAAHNAYEAAAHEAGWTTNIQSRKPWAEVPEANKAAMRAGIGAALALIDKPATKGGA